MDYYKRYDAEDDSFRKTRKTNRKRWSSPPLYERLVVRSRASTGLISREDPSHILLGTITQITAQMKKQNSLPLGLQVSKCWRKNLFIAELEDRESLVPLSLSNDL